MNFGSDIFIDDIGITAMEPVLEEEGVYEEETILQPLQKKTSSKKVNLTDPPRLFIFSVGLFSLIAFVVLLVWYFSRESD